MPRIKPAPPEQYEPRFGKDAPLRVQVYANRPELAAGFLEWGRTLATERILPDRLLELVRLRVAFFNQCRSCMSIRYEEGVADGVTEDLVCSLERPETAEDLTPAERAAIAYADLMATDHLAIDDAVFDRLREHFTEAEIVELCMNVAQFVGYGRMAATLQMVEDLPERFQAEPGVEVAPWGGGDVVRVSAGSPPSAD